MTFNALNLARPNIRQLRPYSSARSEFAGEAEVFLDANENAFGSPAGQTLNRYPDPMHGELKRTIGEMNDIAVENIFVGNGSDEAIDLLIRIFCEPRTEAIIICPPTYGMYRVLAEINDVEVREAPLTNDYQLDGSAIDRVNDARSKLLFICSPNNPTGNLMNRREILRIAREFNGLVVADEAYIHFSDQKSMIRDVEDNPNLVVLQTFSKAWGMAGLRVGMAFADPEVVSLMNAVKPPYNVNTISQRAVLKAIQDEVTVKRWITEAIEQRDRLENELIQITGVEKIFPSDANFLLVKVDRAREHYQFLIDRGIVVRDRSNVLLCEGCLRITVGTAAENSRLIAAMNEFEVLKRI
jgi:histidinol-phosphate aminotransferase